jgi:hypothetical protein
MSEMTAAAQALLTYYPLPNITPNTGSYDNFQANFPGSSHSSQISTRYNRSFGSAPTRGGRGGGGGGGGGRGGGGGGGNSGGGPGTRTQNRNAPPTLRQSIAESFAYQHSASASQSFSPLLNGSTVSNGYSLSSSYTVGYGRINSTATLSWSRSHSDTVNEFTNGLSNPATNPTNLPPDINLYAGSPSIAVGTPQVNTNRFNYGVPSISVSGQTGFSGLSDTSPSNTINQTYTFTDFVSWSHKKHNMRFGLDFHRILNDSNGSNGVLGSFTFSGYSTESPAQQTCNPKTDPNQCKLIPDCRSRPPSLPVSTRSTCAATPGTGTRRTTGAPNPTSPSATAYDGSTSPPTRRRTIIWSTLTSPAPISTTSAPSLPPAVRN